MTTAIATTTTATTATAATGAASIVPASAARFARAHTAARIQFHVPFLSISCLLLCFTVDVLDSVLQSLAGRITLPSLGSTFRLS